jgi:hypothetical protein
MEKDVKSSKYDLADWNDLEILCLTNPRRITRNAYRQT